MKRKSHIEGFLEHTEKLNISGVSDSNSIFNLDEDYIVVKFRETDSQIAFYVFDKNNLPNLEKSNWGKPDFNKKCIAMAWIYDTLNLYKLGYRMIRSKRIQLDLNEVVFHLNAIRVNEKYSGKGLGEKLIKFIMVNLNTNVIYLQPTENSIDYWFHIGCKDTGYNYLDYEYIPLLEYRLKD